MPFCRLFRVEWGWRHLREPITPGAQEKPDLVEGIVCASAVTGRVLLDATTSLTWVVAGEFDDVKGAEHVRLC